MGRHHKHHKHHKYRDPIWHSLSNNHTLKFLADPIKPVEKVVNVAHEDVSAVVGYGGKHLVNDVDTLTNGVAKNLPMVIGAACVIFLFMNRK